MKLDSFTWWVIGIVAVLLVAAVVTVNLTGGEGWGVESYIEEDTPEAPVYNAFLALENGDLNRAREQYAQRILDEIDEQQGYDPLSGRSGDTLARRLRIVEVDINDNDPDRAVVTYVIDTYSSGGPFGGGSTWSRRGTVEVVREDNRWKLNSQEFFY